MGLVFHNVAGRVGGITGGGGRARRLLAVLVRRADSVTPRAGRRTCCGLSFARRWKVTVAGHRVEPGLWREDVVGREGGGAVWSKLRDAGHLSGRHAECGLLGSGEGGPLENWRTGWALTGGTTHEGRSALCLPVLWVCKGDSVTPKLG